MMKNIFKFGALVTGALLLSAFAFISNPDFSSNELSANTQNTAELFAMNTVDSDRKCGEGKSGEAKKSETKEEHKCSGEKCSKCHHPEKKSETQSEEKTEKKSELKEEHKCGEGKCGGQ